MGLSVAEGVLLALFLETLAYGVLVSLYLLTLLILLTRIGTQRRFLIPMATLLFCIATAHLVINFVRVLEAFAFEVQTLDVSAYYGNLASPLDIAQTALYIVQTTLADSIIVWRCYVINRKSLFIAIPGCIGLLVNGLTGCYVVWSISRPAGSAVPINTDNCITMFSVLTVVISVISTGLIALRIYRIPSFMSDRSRVLLPVFIVIIETGALYTVTVFTHLLLFLRGLIGQSTPLYVTTPIVGIAFCLVIIQVHFQMGGSWLAERSTKPTGVAANLPLGQDMRDVGSRGRTTLLTTVHFAEETITESEMVQSDMIGGNERIIP